MRSAASYLVVLFVLDLCTEMRLFKYYPPAPVLLPLQGAATFSHGQERAVKWFSKRAMSLQG